MDRKETGRLRGRTGPEVALEARGLGKDQRVEQGEARGLSREREEAISPYPTAPPRSRYGPNSRRVPPAWKTKEGSGPSADGEGGGNDSRELGDVRTQPPPRSPPPLRKAGPPRRPERSPRRAGSGSQAAAHAQARAAAGGRGGGGEGRGGGAGEQRKAERRGGGGGWGGAWAARAGPRSGAGRSRQAGGCLRQSLP